MAPPVPSNTSSLRREGAVPLQLYFVYLDKSFVVLSGSLIQVKRSFVCVNKTPIKI